MEFDSFEKCELVGEFGVRGKGQTSWSENSTIRGAARSSLRKSEVRGKSLMLVGESEVREDTQKFVGRA
jgi:hypothetical protein